MCIMYTFVFICAQMGDFVWCTSDARCFAVSVFCFSGAQAPRGRGIKARHSARNPKSVDVGTDRQHPCLFRSTQAESHTHRTIMAGSHNTNTARAMFTKLCKNSRNPAP